MLRRRWLPGAASLAACSVVALAACSLVAPKYQKPNLAVTGVELSGGNLLKQNFRVTIHVDNPNDRELPVQDVYLELHVLGETVASGVSAAAFVVPARGETQFDMKITTSIALTVLKLAGRSDIQQNAVPYDVSGNAHVDLPFVHELKFQQNGTFSLSGNH